MSGNDDSSSSDDGMDWVDYHKDVNAVLGDVRRNSRNLAWLSMIPFEAAPLDPHRWVKLGQDLGENTRLKKFWLSAEGDDDGHVIASKEHLEAFCRGLARNRSLRFLHLEWWDFSRARLAILHPFVVENPMLRELHLCNCILDAADVEMLAAAFRWNRHGSLRTIQISGSTIGDDAMPAIEELCNECPELKYLLLEFSNIGDDGCMAIASLLRSPFSQLKCVDLSSNTKIGDAGALFLANAIASNKSVERLSLNGCPSITSKGWAGFSESLCNRSSIDATHRSNHKLQRLWRSDFSKDGMSLPEDVWFGLESNRETDKIKVARKKIVRFHLRGDFDLAQLGMDIEVLPLVLGWIGNGYNASDLDLEHDDNIVQAHSNHFGPGMWWDTWIRYDDRLRRSRCTAFYRILRNAPDLCSYAPSPREVRSQMVAENAALKSDVAALQAQVEQLRLEVEGLQSNKRVRND